MNIFLLANKFYKFLYNDIGKLIYIQKILLILNLKKIESKSNIILLKYI